MYIILDMIGITYVISVLDILLIPNSYKDVANHLSESIET